MSQIDDMAAGQYEAARVPAVASEADARRRLERDDRARRALAGFALSVEDPPGWLGDMLDALGLRGVDRG